MKLPFVSRSHFNDMLHEKNSQISDRDRQIGDLKAEHDLLGRTQDRCHDIIRELHGQLAHCQLRILHLDHEISHILESLPESVFNQICPPANKTGTTPASKQSCTGLKADNATSSDQKRPHRDAIKAARNRSN